MINPTTLKLDWWTLQVDSVGKSPWCRLWWREFWLWVWRPLVQMCSALIWAEAPLDNVYMQEQEGVEHINIAKFQWSSSEEQAGQYMSWPAWNVGTRTQSASIIEACHNWVKPGGHVFFSTINRNPKITCLPLLALNMSCAKGTHDYQKFIKPQNWHMIFAAVQGSKPWRVLHYNPLTKRYWLAPNVDVNYMVYTVKEGAACPAVLFDLNGTIDRNLPLTLFRIIPRHVPWKGRRCGRCRPDPLISERCTGDGKLVYPELEVKTRVFLAHRHVFRYLRCQYRSRYRPVFGHVSAYWTEKLETKRFFGAYHQ